MSDEIFAGCQGCWNRYGPVQRVNDGVAGPFSSILRPGYEALVVDLELQNPSVLLYVIDLEVI